MSSYWKKIELRVAKYFNTVRRNRGNDFSQSDVEIIADISTWLDNPAIEGKIIAECKYRTSELGIITTFNELRDSKKTSLGLIGDDIVITTLDSFQKVFLLLVWHGALPLEDLAAFEVFQVKQSCPKYVDEYISQARQYVPETAVDVPRTLPTLPILCCAKGRTKGLYALFSIEDAKSFGKAKDSYRVS